MKEAVDRVRFFTLGFAYDGEAPLMWHQSGCTFAQMSAERWGKH